MYKEDLEVLRWLRNGKASREEVCSRFPSHVVDYLENAGLVSGTRVLCITEMGEDYLSVFEDAEKLDDLAMLIRSGEPRTTRRYQDAVDRVASIKPYRGRS